MSLPTRPTTLLSALDALASPGVAEGTLAVRVLLEDGGSVEGQLLEVSPSLVFVQARDGDRTVDPRAIRRIEVAEPMRRREVVVAGAGAAFWGMLLRRPRFRRWLSRWVTIYEGGGGGLPKS